MLAGSRFKLWEVLLLRRCRRGCTAIYEVVLEGDVGVGRRDELCVRAPFDYSSCKESLKATLLSVAAVFHPLFIYRRKGKKRDSQYIARKLTAKLHHTKSDIHHTKTLHLGFVTRKVTYIIQKRYIIKSFVKIDH